MSLPQAEWPAHPPAVWPTKQHSPCAQSVKALPVTPMDGLTDRTAKRASFSSLSLNRFSLHKGRSKTQEQPPPLPTKASVAPQNKFGKKTTTTGSLRAVYKRSSGVEEILVNSSRWTTLVSPPPAIKQPRSFFKRMTDRLTRSRPSLQEDYKKNKTKDSPGEQSPTSQVAQTIGTSIIKIPASPSSPSLLQTPHSPALPSPRRSHPPPPSPHPPPTHALPPTPTHALPPTPTAHHLSLTSPNPSIPVTSILPSMNNKTHTRKSRPTAIQIPRGDTEHATTTPGDPSYNLPYSANNSRFPRDITVTPRSSMATLRPTTLVSTPIQDTRDPLPLSFPLPPLSPPVNTESPRKSCFSPSRSLASPSSATVRRTSSARIGAPSGSPITPRRKAESARGGEAIDKGLDIPRRLPKPLGRVQLVQETNRIVPPPHVSSHVRADSDTLADIDLQMAMEIHSQTISQPSDLVLRKQTPPPHSESLSLAETRAQRRIQNHLLMLPAEIRGIERADSPTIPGADMCVEGVEQAAQSPGLAQSSHQISYVGEFQTSQPKTPNSKRDVNRSNISISRFVETPVTSSSDDEGHLKVDRWLAGSPTDTEKSISTTASLNAWRGTMGDRDGEEDIIPVIEHVALEIAERAADSILMRKGEEARKRRSLFSKKERHVVTLDLDHITTCLSYGLLHITNALLTLRHSFILIVKAYIALT
ncbi:hypothetical protein BU17DRAFT_68294 [Hysterangium stoloniferum]|nr:hypothetical protein BU17DRAFT_68294 [Hysterangium stoloniferum]